MPRPTKIKTPLTTSRRERLEQMESRVARLEAEIYGTRGVVAEMHCVLAPPVAKLELVRDEEEQ